MQKLHIVMEKGCFKMRCPTCGEKVQFMDGSFICKICDSEYDILDTDEILISEPIFVSVELLSQYAIIDTRKQEVFVRVDTFRKAKLITDLLNQHYSQKIIKRLITNEYILKNNYH